MATLEEMQARLSQLGAEFHRKLDEYCRRTGKRPEEVSAFFVPELHDTIVEQSKLLKALEKRIAHGPPAVRALKIAGKVAISPFVIYNKLMGGTGNALGQISTGAPRRSSGTMPRPRSRANMSIYPWGKHHGH